MRYILLTEKTWHIELFKNLQSRKSEKWIRISNREEFHLSLLEEFNPDKIFIPHWSYIIPREVWIAYDCVVFHMTDLPYGRGGSPLQNLIVRGHKETMISAIKVEEGIDTGPVYLKKPLSLSGTAQAIFEHSALVIEKMIVKIIEEDLKPIPQQGEPVLFKRRRPIDGCMNKLKEVEEVYDYIRMLDAEGYPPAFIETDQLKIEFTAAKCINNTEVIANVRITKK